MIGVINIKDKFQIDLVSTPIGLVGIVMLFFNSWYGLPITIFGLILLYIRLSEWDRQRETKNETKN